MPGGTLTGGRLGRLFLPMCGRYAREFSNGELVEIFKIRHEKLQSEINYDVKPGTPVSSIRLDAKGENVHRYPAYCESFARRRCLVPATDYYEWKEIAPKVKQRFCFTRRDGQFIAFPALYTEKEDPLATITSPPSEDIATVHDRTPVILEAEHWKRYLDPEPLSDDERKAMIATSSAGLLDMWPVANKATGEELTKPIEPLTGQADLFG